MSWSIQTNLGETCEENFEVKFTGVCVCIIGYRVIVMLMLYLYGTFIPAILCWLLRIIEEGNVSFITISVHTMFSELYFS